MREQTTASGRVVKTAHPAWVEWRGGPCAVRLPFHDPIDPTDSGWRYILDMTCLGFRADRVGDAVVLTGRPQLWGYAPS